MTKAKILRKKTNKSSSFFIDTNYTLLSGCHLVKIKPTFYVSIDILTQPIKTHEIPHNNHNRSNRLELVYIHLSFE